MSMLVAHMNKMKMPDLDGLQMHIERKRARHSNPDIDVKRSGLNYELSNRDMSQSYFDQIMTLIIDKTTSKRKVRKDAVVVSSWIISSDSDFFECLNSEEIRKYFEASKDFFAENYGEENIAFANVHLDETTPHMHLGVIPLRDGRLCANKIFDKKELLRIQNELPKYLQERGFDLERGREGSGAKHLSVADYKKKVAEDEIHALLDEYGIKREKTELVPQESGGIREEVVAMPIKERVDKFMEMLTQRLEEYKKLNELGELQMEHNKFNKQDDENAIISDTTKRDFLLESPKLPELLEETFKSIIKDMNDLRIVLYTKYTKHNPLNIPPYKEVCYFRDDNGNRLETDDFIKYKGNKIITSVTSIIDDLK